MTPEATPRPDSGSELSPTTPAGHGSPARGRAVSIWSMVLLEVGVLAVAGGLAWLLAVDPLSGMAWSVGSWSWGLVGSLPLVGGLWFLDHTSIDAIVQLRRTVEDLFGHYFRGVRPIGVIVLAVVAGVAEEMLFRGVLQPWAADRLGWLAAVVLVGALFGLVHSVTPLYAMLAAGAGVYLGILMTLTGNVAVPIIAHAVYDMVALGYFLRESAGQEPGDDGGLDGSPAVAPAEDQ